MLSQFSRFELLIGKKGIETLSKKTVAIFGIGGVGGYVVEALARSGVGHLVLIDNDEVALTNINRQIIATHETLNQPKVEVAKERVLSINPDCQVDTIQKFYLPENASEFDFSSFDYVVDAIDTVSAKLDIICRCKENNIPVISALGAGNKMDPSKLTVTDIYKTENDPLAKVMRHELRKRGIKTLKVVYSSEKPISPDPEAFHECQQENPSRRACPGSSPFVPPASGLLLASEVVKDLLS